MVEIRWLTKRLAALGVGEPPNNSMQRTALRAAADVERSLAAQKQVGVLA